MDNCFTCFFQISKKTQIAKIEILFIYLKRTQFLFKADISTIKHFLSCPTYLYLKFIHTILQSNVTFLSPCLCVSFVILDIFLWLHLTEWEGTVGTSQFFRAVLYSSLRILSPSQSKIWRSYFPLINLFLKRANEWM